MPGIPREKGLKWHHCDAELWSCPQSNRIHYYFYYFVVLGMKGRDIHMVVKCFTTEPLSQPRAVEFFDVSNQNDKR
jgi:hypothetical protein